MPFLSTQSPRYARLSVEYKLRFFSGLPKEDAQVPRRITRIEADVQLHQPVGVALIKDETCPGDPKACIGQPAKDTQIAHLT